MNYRHVYHAGNFADVFKHLLLSLLLKALCQKDTPFFYLDTHAGAGRYDLNSAAARKTGEHRDGILRLWNRQPFSGIEDYLSAVRALNTGDELRYYPGSPRLARYFLRPQDRAVLLELHPDECAQLKIEFARDSQLTVLRQDGYAGLKVFLPPRERRGLVLIDPPYESDREFQKLMQGLRESYARWGSGQYVFWYPIKSRPPVERFHRELVSAGIRKILLAEFSPYPEDSDFRLNGCGMVMINPPWKLDVLLRSLLPELMNVLRLQGVGRTAITWLVPE